MLTLSLNSLNPGGCLKALGPGAAVFKLNVATGGSSVEADVIGVECKMGNTVGTVVAELEWTAGNTVTGVGTAGSFRLVSLLRAGAVHGVSTARPG